MRQQLVDAAVEQRRQPPERVAQVDPRDSVHREDVDHHDPRLLVVLQDCDTQHFIGRMAQQREGHEMVVVGAQDVGLPVRLKERCHIHRLPRSCSARHGRDVDARIAQVRWCQPGADCNSLNGRKLLRRCRQAGAGFLAAAGHRSNAASM